MWWIPNHLRRASCLLLATQRSDLVTARRDRWVRITIAFCNRTSWKYCARYNIDWKSRQREPYWWPVQLMSLLSRKKKSFLNTLLTTKWNVQSYQHVTPYLLIGDFLLVRTSLKPLGIISSQLSSSLFSVFLTTTTTANGAIIMINGTAVLSIVQ